MKILLHPVACRCAGILTNLCSFFWQVSMTWNHLFILYVKFLTPRDKNCQAPKFKSREVRILIVYKACHQMELVLINSGIPKFNFAYSMVAMKSWVWIADAQTAPLSREQASHSFPWVASVTNQACRREARGFLTVSSTKRCCSFILAVGYTILRRQLCVAEPSFITQNVSFLHSCRTLGYGILEGDGTDRRLHWETAVKMLCLIKSLCAVQCFQLLNEHNSKGNLLFIICTIVYSYHICHFYFFADNFQLAQFDSSSWIYLNTKAKKVYIDILAIIVSIFQVLQKPYLNRIFLDIKQASNTIAEKWPFIFHLILFWTTRWWGHSEGIPRHTEKHPCI